MCPVRVRHSPRGEERPPMGWKFPVPQPLDLRRLRGRTPGDFERKMTNLRKLEKKLEKKGITNVEVTKLGKDYFILRICKNNNPVPLFKTQNRQDLISYLNAEYEIDAR